MLSRRALAAALPLSALLVAIPALTGPARAQRSWAPASSATIRPGVMTDTKGGTCTANFVFTDAAGAVYLGQAAHCSGTGAATETNGCSAESYPLGTPVDVMGASRPGTLAYNSWLAMQAAGETNENACNFNDFALVRLDPADESKVNPTVPIWGGPSRLGTGTRPGSQVYSYGNSPLRLGISQLSPKTGVSLGDEAGGWTRSVYTVTPGIPGDSGSGFLNSSG
ncbi:MAG: serine protease, partial [Actinomycetes bacterium]